MMKIKEKFEHPFSPYGSFVGRESELTDLTTWYGDDSSPILLVNAIGGAGKSSLTWVWLKSAIGHTELPFKVSAPKIHDDTLQGTYWYSFYESGARFRDFISKLMDFLSLESRDGLSFKEIVDLVVNELTEKRFLIVCDGLERILHMYNRLDAPYLGDEIIDSANIAQEENNRAFFDSMASRFFHLIASRVAKTKIICTTREIPSDLQSDQNPAILLAGIQKFELQGLDPDASLEFFTNEGFNFKMGEIRLVGGPIDYHPLYLRLIVGFLLNLPPSQRNDLTEAINYSPGDDLVARKHHIFEQAFKALPAKHRQLLSRMSAFRTSTDIDMIKAIAPFDDLAEYSDLIEALNNLERARLISFDPVNEVYTYHPIVRGYAYSKLSDEEQMSTHEKALDVLQSREEISILKKDKSTLLDSSSSKDLVTVESWGGTIRVADHFAGLPDEILFDQKSVNILARTLELIYHLLGAEQVEEALNLYRDRVSDYLFFRLANYFEAIAVLSEFNKPDILKRLRNMEDRVWVQNALAMCYSRIGHSEKAKPLYHNAIKTSQREKFYSSHSIILQNLSEDYRCEGMLRKCDELLLMSRKLAEKGGDEIALGLTYRLRGFVLNTIMPKGGMDELKHGLKLLDGKGVPHIVLYFYTNMAWGYLFANMPSLAIRNLELARTFSAKLNYKRDITRIAFLQGKTNRIQRKFREAIEPLEKALSICTEINLVEIEADILIELARARIGLRSNGIEFHTRTWKYLKKALVISQASKLVLQEADAHLALATLCLNSKTYVSPEMGFINFDDPGYLNSALREATSALISADCDGGEYKYLSTFQESNKLIRKIKFLRITKQFRSWIHELVDFLRSKGNSKEALPKNETHSRFTNRAYIIAGSIVALVIVVLLGLAAIIDFGDTIIGVIFVIISFLVSIFTSKKRE